MSGGFDNPAAYDAWYETPLGRLSGELERRALLELAALRAGEQVLEIGSGTGYFTRALAKTGAAVTAIDSSKAMAAYAGQRAQREGVNADFLVGDAAALPLPDASFDLVAGVTVLCFAAAPEKIIAETFRVLKPGGRMVIGELNRRSPWAVVRKARARLRESHYRQARFFRPAELESLMAAAGFEDVGYRTLLYFPPLNRSALLGRYRFFESAGKRLAPCSGAFVAIRGSKPA